MAGHSNNTLIHRDLSFSLVFPSYQGHQADLTGDSRDSGSERQLRPLSDQVPFSIRILQHSQLQPRFCQLLFQVSLVLREVLSAQLHSPSFSPRFQAWISTNSSRHVSRDATGSRKCNSLLNFRYLNCLLVEIRDGCPMRPLQRCSRR